MLDADNLPISDGGPLPVFFKLPVSEISEIDDHKSVRIAFALLNSKENAECINFSQSKNFDVILIPNKHETYVLHSKVE